MDFIQTSNKQLDKFGAGEHGFSGGNPSGGVSATFMSPEWCDDVQQELINVIKAAGIAPAAATRNQLLLALRSAGVFQTPPTGDRTTKAATTAMFGTEFAASLAVPGYQRLPSGLIIQWGIWSSHATPGNAVAVAFPLAFPTAIRSLVVSASANTTAQHSAWFTNETVTGFDGRATTVGNSCRYIALGN